MVMQASSGLTCARLGIVGMRRRRALKGVRARGKRARRLESERSLLFLHSSIPPARRLLTPPRPLVLPMSTPSDWLDAVLSARGRGALPYRGESKWGVRQHLLDLVQVRETRWP